MKHIITICFCLLATNFILAQTLDSYFWEDINPLELRNINSEEPNIPTQFRTLKLKATDLNGFIQNLITNTSNNSSVATLLLPLPNNTIQRYAVTESSIMAPALAAQNPQIKTFKGSGIDDPTATMRFVWSSSGFHAFIYSQKGKILIEKMEGGNEWYRSYYLKHLPSPSFSCELMTDDLATDNSVHPPSVNPPTNTEMPTFRWEQNNSPLAIGPELKTIRFAMSIPEFWMSAFNNSQENAANYVAQKTSDLNVIFERDLSIHLELIPENNMLLPPLPNPYNSGYASGNQDYLEEYIGVENFDGGIVIGPWTDGIATSGGFCNNSAKGQAASGTNLKILAHELGHMMDATHSFNRCSSGGQGWEPGSGNTLMSYQGICGSYNMPGGQLLYFHPKSFEEIITYMHHDTPNCGTITNTGNAPPIVSVPASGFSIPINTPFALIGSASDDGPIENLTYSWEQIDKGSTSNDPNYPTGTAPIFRSMPYSNTPTRTFPELSKIVEGTWDFGEVLPTYSRALNFSLMAKDNIGGVDYGQLQFYVCEGAGPFQVTLPADENTIWTVGQTRTVEWDVANTDQVPVNCATVNILISYDGGYTYPETLAAGVPNDGSHEVIVPDMVGTDNRIKVEAADNIFFNISANNFPIYGAEYSDFEVDARPFMQHICEEATASFDIEVQALGGFSNSVELNVEGLPDGVTSNFPVQVAPTSISTLTLQNTNTIPNGNYPLTIRYSEVGGVMEYTKVINLFKKGNPEPTLGTAIRFTGALDSHFSIPDNEQTLDFASTEGFTLEAWIKLTGAGIDATVIGKKLDLGSTYPGWELRVENYGRFVFVIADGNKEIEIETPYSEYDEDDSWHHVAVTYSPVGAGSLQLYVNGALRAYNVVTGLGDISNDEPIRMGTNRLRAYLEELRIWQGTKSRIEIKEGMHIISPACASNLVAAWQFNAVGDQIIDLVGNYNSLSTTTPKITSTAPIGSGQSFTQVLQSNALDFEPANFNAEISSSSQDRVTISHIQQAPYGTDGLDLQHVPQEQYWITDVLDDTYLGLSDITFQSIDASIDDFSSPYLFKLYRRSQNSEGSWSYEGEGISGNATNNSITFQDYWGQGQYLLTRSTNPQMALNKSSISFCPIDVNASQVKTFLVTAGNITDDCIIQTTEHFKISETIDGNFSTQLNISPTEDNSIVKTIYVEFAPSTVGSFTGDIMAEIGDFMETISLSGETVGATDDVSGTALQMLDGENVEIPHTADFELLGTTVECWIKMDFTCKGWNNIHTIWSLYPKYSVSFMNRRLSNDFQTMDLVIPDQEWFHLAYVFETETPRVYLNGVEYTDDRIRAISRTSTFTPQNFSWGRRSGGSGGCFEVDEIKIWKSTKTVEELQNHKHLTMDLEDGNCLADEGLLYYYHFNENEHGWLKNAMGQFELIPSTNVTTTQLIDNRLPIAEGVFVRKTISSAQAYNFQDGNQDAQVTIDYTGQSIQTGDVVVNYLTGEGPKNNVNGSINTNSYWVVKQYETTNIGNAQSMTFTVDLELSASDETMPEVFKLYQRDVHDEGDWTLKETATAVHATNNTITFATLHPIGQFIIVDTRCVDNDDCIGCTDVNAHNYAPTAIYNDDSCETCDDGIMNGDETGVDCGGSRCAPCEGCTDVNAHNYDPIATVNDGSCQTCNDGIMNGDETDVDCGGTLCDPCQGCTDENAHNYDPIATVDDGSCQTCDDEVMNGDETGVDCGGTLCTPCQGCTDENAHNFDPIATIDDGSCETCDDEVMNGDETGVDCGGTLCAPCQGCTDENAHNFDPIATIDDGSCETCDDEVMNGDETGVDCGGAICAPCQGCTDENAHNFDPIATVDDGSCQTCDDIVMNGDETGVDCGGALCEPCQGCTDENAHNFDPIATIDDGSCQTCDDEIMNGDETGVDCGGAICAPCQGCTDENAHNFDPIATVDDESCETCDDGIMNGDETGVDCGGLLCEPCPDPCPPTQDLSGDVVNEVRLVRAAGDIISNEHIMGTSDVTYAAGSSILLEAGFTVDLGSQFLAMLDNCGANFNGQEETHFRTNPTDIPMLEATTLQLFPNPFREEVNLVFNLPKSSVIDLGIYTVDGQQVAHIFQSSWKEKGQHQVVFNGNDLKTGVYFVRLIAEERIVTASLVLVR